MKKQKNLKFKGYLVYLFLILTVFTTVGCKKKKQAFPFWMAALTGESSSTYTPSNTGDNDETALNPDGDPLPQNSTSDGAKDSKGEILTAGPAKITGQVQVMADETTPEIYCTSSGVPAGCFDATNVPVKLLDSDGNVVAETTLDKDGNYSFDIENLKNGGYQVYVPTGNGVNTANQNIDFTYGQNGTTEVEVATLNPFSRTFEDGAGRISGTVKTPGHLDHNGDPVLSAGPIEGVSVKLYKQDENGALNVGGIKYSYMDIQTTTDADGNYSFDLTSKENGAYPLKNGENYLVYVEGSQKTESGRSFEDSTSGFKFNYTASKSDNSIVQEVPLGISNLSWDAATSSDIALNGSLSIASPTGNSKDGFTVNLKDSSGNIVATATTDSDGNYSINHSDLSNGTYEVEISKDGFETISQSFNFVADATGGTVNRTMSSVKVLPEFTRVTGSITDGANPISSAVINFRPSASLTAADIQYIVDNYPDLKNAALKWQQEIQATGKAQTFLSKTYEKDSEGNLYFDALPGVWDYYVSANGYESTALKTITLDGTQQTKNETLVSSTKRSRVAGTAIVVDTLTDGTQNAYPGGVPGYNSKGHYVPGLINVMLNNQDTSGNSVAHIAITGADGKYEFTDLHVVLPSTLGSDEQRVAYAIGEFTKCLQGASSQMKSHSGGNYGGCTTGANSIMTTSTGGTEPLFLDGGKFYFKEGSYSVFTVDPRQHMDTSLTVIDVYGSDVDKDGDGNPDGTAENAIVGMPSSAVTSANTIVPHLPRRKITGTVSDAISTGVISGATLNLCTAIAADGTCTFARRDNETIPNTSRLTGGDEAVPSVSTDANGDYVFDNIDPGTYKIQVIKDGYVAGVVDVVVPTDGTGLAEGGDTVAGVNPKIVKDGAGGDIRGTVVLSDGTPFTDPYTIELTHPSSGAHPIGGITPSGLGSGAVTFGPNASRFDVFSVNPGEWKIKFVSAGYKTVEGLVTVQSNAVTNFEIVTMIPGSREPASVAGVVRSALNNRPVEGLTVRIRSGLNIQSGAIATDANGNEIPAVSTGSDGSFVIPNVPAGNYTVEISGTGTNNGVTDSYATTYGTVISAGSDTPASQDFLISPKLGTNEVRIVLSWGAQPRDLDSHLEYGSSKPDQVVWNAKNRLGGDLKLDIDVVEGYGPETVTMKGSVWNQPRRGYSVFNWSKYRDSSVEDISNSGAIVRVFKGTQGLVRTYVAGPGQTGKWWHIFCLDSSKNIIDVGQTGCNKSDFFNAPYN